MRPTPIGTSPVSPVSSPPGTFGNFSGRLFTQNGVTNASASNLEQVVVPPGQARVYRNDVAEDIHYINLHVEGFQYGLRVPRHGSNVIDGGYFNNLVNIQIKVDDESGYSVEFIGEIEFGVLPEYVFPGKTRINIDYI